MLSRLIRRPVSPRMAEPPFQLSRVSGAPVTDQELIADLQRIASSLGSGTVPQKTYGSLGTFDYSTLIRRFGSWNNALWVAGLSISNEISYSDERLFENLLVLWQYFGRQPRRSELSSPPSAISQTPYNRRFGSWTAALQAFVDFANGTGAESPTASGEVSPARRTGRDPSLRLRWRVLQRDRFSCCGCGASPAITLGVELHVDHIVPWSKGGETEFENLQTLCSACNLGKSNVG